MSRACSETSLPLKPKGKRTYRVYSGDRVIGPIFSLRQALRIAGNLTEASIWYRDGEDDIWHLDLYMETKPFGPDDFDRAKEISEKRRTSSEI